MPNISKKTLGKSAWSMSAPIIKLPNSFINQLSKLTNRINNAFTSIDFTFFEKISKIVQKLPIKIQIALSTLGENGWYLDYEMGITQLWEIEKMLLLNNIMDVDKILIDYYEKNIDFIENRLCNLYPKRKTVLLKAFKAHRQEDYELSIPVFLAQSDGICKEKINKYIFMKNNKKPEVAQYVESLASDGFARALLSPLTENLPILKSSKDRGPTFTELNRHMVLHGESSDYGNQLFGCKAVSLINYIAWAFE